MAYQVDKFNGTFFVSIEDGTIDTTTDLRLVGKNYAGYGEVQNENFLHLLENFANTSAPSKAIAGQIWYDSANKKLKFYDGTKFKIASGAEVGSSAPSGLTAGDFWFDETAQQLYTWSGTEFVLIGPETAPEFGSSAAVGQVVYSNTGDPYSIIRLVVGDDTVAVVSRSEFTLGNTNNITGFDRIKKGITMINTQQITDGVTSTDHYFWGSASNSERLGGQLADVYLRRDNLEFGETVSFGDLGYVLGDDNDLIVKVETQDPTAVDSLRDEDQVVIYQSAEDQPITFRIQFNRSEARNVLKIRSTGLFPGLEEALDIGSADNKWFNVYANTITGNLIGNVTGDVVGSVKGNIQASDDTLAFDYQSKIIYAQIGTPDQRSLMYGDMVGDVTGSASSALSLGVYEPSLSATPETVAIRDSSGAITAESFIGTSTQTDLLKISGDPTYREASTTHVTGTPTIAARTSSGTINAVIFDGVATSARYADLAEKYIPAADYEPGTVVSVCDHEEHEVEACQWGQRAIGVVSTNPAFMMNKDLEGGIYIALKGRVPTKVTGVVRKGQRLVAGNNGTAVAAVPHANDVFAIALESSDDIGVKIIEAIIL